MYIEERQNGERDPQKALRFPFPLNWGRVLWEGDESFQVVWRTDLEVGLERTQNYCVDLLLVKSLSLHGICRSFRQTETYSLAMDC